MMCGGFTNDRPMEDDVKQLALQLKGAVEAKMNATYATFEPETFQSQVVAGTNYSIKVKTDKGHIVMKVFVPLPCNGTEPVLKEVKAA